MALALSNHRRQRISQDIEPFSLSDDRHYRIPSNPPTFVVRLPPSPSISRTPESTSSVVPSEQGSNTWPPGEVCINYLRQKCPWGTRCHRIHAAPNALTLSHPRASPPYTPSLDSSSVSECNQGRAVCIDWLHGRCFRELCKYQHVIRNDNHFDSSISTLASKRALRVKLPCTADTTSSPLLSSIVPCRNRSTHGVNSHQMDIPDSKPENAIQNRSTKLQEQSTQLTIDSCRVIIGSGCLVQGIQTGFESSSILIEQLPPHWAVDQVETLVSPHGKVLNLELQNERRRCVVEFRTAVEAGRAVSALHGLSINGGKLLCALYGISTTSSNHLRSCSLTVHWKHPPTTLLAKYAAFGEANDVLCSLDGRTIQNRLIKVTHQLRDDILANQFELRIEGLPVGLEHDQLGSLIKTSNYTFLWSFSTSVGEMAQRIQDLLKSVASLQKYEWRAVDSIHEDAVAYAEYLFPEHAIQAKEKCHGLKLDGVRLRVQHVHSLQFSVSTSIFTSILSDIENLRDEALCLKPRIHLRWAVCPKQSSVIKIFLNGEKLSDLSRLRQKVKSVLQGMPLIDEQGAPLWHRYFQSSSSYIFLRRVEKDARLVINCDQRRRTISFFGSDEAQVNARSIILSKLKEFASQTCIFGLQNRSLSFFMRGGLACFQKRFGQDAVRIDLLGRRLLIHGNPTAAQEARLAINNAINQREVASFHQSAAEFCPICTDLVSEPLTLSCGHTYCRGCLRHYLLSSADGNSFPICCLYSDGQQVCHRHISIFHVRMALSDEERDSLFKASFLAHIRRSPQEFRYCPTPDCSQIYRISDVADPRALQCPSCLLLICPYCCTEHHSGISCRQWKDNDAGLLEEWKEQHDVKVCPGCQACIERESGCNHMTCSHCGTHMCWQCLKTFRESEKVYDHMHSVHGGIGLY